MEKYTYTLEDLIKNRIEFLENTISDCDYFVQEFTREYRKVPELWDYSNFKDWDEFRRMRTEHFINCKKDSKQYRKMKIKPFIQNEPNNAFPQPTFSLRDPGAVSIIKDDCKDLLKIIKMKNFLEMNSEYVQSVFFATDTTKARLQFMYGYFLLTVSKLCTHIL